MVGAIVVLGTLGIIAGVVVSYLDYKLKKQKAEFNASIEAIRKREQR